MRQGCEVCAIFGSLIGAFGVPVNIFLENAQPGQCRGGGEHGGTRVADHGSKRLGAPEHQGDRGEPRGPGSRDQGDVPGRIAVQGRTRQEEPAADGEQPDRRHVPGDVDHRPGHPGTTEASGRQHPGRELPHHEHLPCGSVNGGAEDGERSGDDQRDVHELNDRLRISTFISLAKVAYIHACMLHMATAMRPSTTQAPASGQRSTQAERSARSRGALLESAARGLSRYGYGNLKLEDVAREAGYTRGALYHQFKDKEDLALAVIEWADESWNREFGNPAKRAPDPVGELMALARG